MQSVSLPSDSAEATALRHLPRLPAPYTPSRPTITISARASFKMSRTALIRRVAALMPRATKADRLVHYENTVETVRSRAPCRRRVRRPLSGPTRTLTRPWPSLQAFPFSKMAIRRPRLFRVLYFGSLAGAFSVPWMVRDSRRHQTAQSLADVAIVVVALQVIRYQLGKQGKWMCIPPLSGRCVRRLRTTGLTLRPRLAPFCSADGTTVRPSPTPLLPTLPPPPPGRRSFPHGRSPQTDAISPFCLPPLVEN